MTGLEAGEDPCGGQEPCPFSVPGAEPEVPLPRGMPALGRQLEAGGLEMLENGGRKGTIASMLLMLLFSCGCDVAALCYESVELGKPLPPSGALPAETRRSQFGIGYIGGDLAKGSVSSLFTHRYIHGLWVLTDDGGKVEAKCYASTAFRGYGYLCVSELRIVMDVVIPEQWFDNTPESWNTAKVLAYLGKFDDEARLQHRVPAAPSTKSDGAATAASGSASDPIGRTLPPATSQEGNQIDAPSSTSHLIDRLSAIWSAIPDGATAGAHPRLASGLIIMATALCSVPSNDSHYLSEFQCVQCLGTALGASGALSDGMQRGYTETFDCSRGTWDKCTVTVHNLGGRHFRVEVRQGEAVLVP